MNSKTTGFASPAQGYEVEAIDLNRLLITNPPATYFLRMESSDMAELGLPLGSLLVVDRSKEPVHNSLVLIRHEGQFYCRLMRQTPSAPGTAGKTLFTNGTTEIKPDEETEIIGTVTASIKTYDNAH